MSNSLALVTGATSGIGLAISDLLAKKGIPLILSGRDLDQLHLLQEQLSTWVDVQIVKADLSQADGRRRLIAILHEQTPDLIINNAGFGLYGEALSFTTSEQVAMLEVNSRAVLELTLEAARSLFSKDLQGVILNVSSAAGFQIFPNLAVYSASKAFVTNFSQAFDDEVKQYGIRVLTICPGMVATSFQSRAGGENLEGAMSASYVAEQIWKQVQNLKPLSIINWRFRLLTFLSFFVPKKWIAFVGKNNIAKRITPRTIIKVKSQ